MPSMGRFAVEDVDTAAETAAEEPQEETTQVADAAEQEAQEEEREPDIFGEEEAAPAKKGAVPYPRFAKVNDRAKAAEANASDLEARLLDVNTKLAEAQGRLAVSDQVLGTLTKVYDGNASALTFDHALVDLVQEAINGGDETLHTALKPLIEKAQDRATNLGTQNQGGDMTDIRSGNQAQQDTTDDNKTPETNPALRALNMRTVDDVIGNMVPRERDRLRDHLEQTLDHGRDVSPDAVKDEVRAYAKRYSLTTEDFFGPKEEKGKAPRTPGQGRAATTQRAKGAADKKPADLAREVTTTEEWKARQADRIEALTTRG